MKTIILFTILILNLSVANAQHPFSSLRVINKDVKVLSRNAIGYKKQLK